MQLTTLNSQRPIPYYAVHKDGIIAGFFGIFRFLSNYEVLWNGVWYEKLLYPSTENAYQAAKWPIGKRNQFTSISPGASKKLGKEAPNLDVKKWDKMKYSIMSGLVHQKFKNNDKLRQMLLMTEGCYLEERNSWNDRYWGTDVNGVGENNLGKILMNVRFNLNLKKSDIF